MSDEIPVLIDTSGMEAVYELLKQQDLDTFAIAKLTGFGRSTVKYYIASLLAEDRIFKYKLEPHRHNSRMAYTVDESKGMEEEEPPIKPTIPGARVYLLRDKSREAINKEISRSQFTTVGKNYPGTSWANVEMAL
jgi:hypothetical protein